MPMEPEPVPGAPTIMSATPVTVAPEENVPPGLAPAAFLAVFLHPAAFLVAFLAPATLWNLPMEPEPVPGAPIIMSATPVTVAPEESFSPWPG